MMLWLPKYRDIEIPSPRVGVAGKYRLVVSEHDGSIAKDTGWFDNIITNYGLDRIGVGSLNSPYAFIGTGTSTPVATDSTLTAAVLGSSSSGGSFSKLTTSPYNSSATSAYRFSIGSLNGTYTEVGIGDNSNSASAGTIKSRALILTAGGAPTSITVTSAQQLDIYYTAQKFPPLIDTSNVVTIDGVSTTVTGRAMAADDSGTWDGTLAYSNPDAALIGYLGGGALGSITGTPTGSAAGGGYDSYGGSSPAYAPGSYSRSYTANLGTANANVSGGISHLAIYWRTSGFGSAQAGFQYALSSNIFKDATKTMMLQFGISWARV